MSNREMRLAYRNLIDENKIIKFIGEINKDSELIKDLILFADKIYNDKDLTGSDLDDTDFAKYGVSIDGMSADHDNYYKRFVYTYNLNVEDIGDITMRLLSAPNSIYVENERIYGKSNKSLIQEKNKIANFLYMYDFIHLDNSWSVIIYESFDYYFYTWLYKYHTDDEWYSILYQYANIVYSYVILYDGYNDMNLNKLAIKKVPYEFVIEYSYNTKNVKGTHKIKTYGNLLVLTDMTNLISPSNVKMFQNQYIQEHDIGKHKSRKINELCIRK